MYFIDPNSGANAYWYIDSNGDVGLTYEPQSAETFNMREIVRQH